MANVVLVAMLCICGAQADASKSDAATALLQYVSRSGKMLSGGSHKAQLDQTLASVSKLASDVTKGKEKISDETKAALAGIKTQMGEVKKDLMAEKQEDQGEVTDANQAIADCEATLPATTTVTGLGTAHDTCRGQEVALVSDACDIWGAYQAGVKTPDCVPCDGSLWTVECMKTVTAWSATHNATMAGKEKDCNDASALHSGKIDECNQAQSEYESGFCSHRAVVNTKCDTQESCVTTKTTARDTTVGNVEKAEEAAKAGWVAAEKIICYVGVLEAAEAQMATKLSACDALVVDTSSLDISYPGTPTVPECDRTFVATYPGHIEWSTEEYASKAWFNAAPPASSVPCVDE